MKSILKRTISLFLTAALTITMITCLPVISSAQNITVWDAASELVAGETYTITDRTVIANDFTIPAGVTLNVGDGGSLTLARSMILTVSGTLNIDEGATLDIRKASIELEGRGRINISGSLLNGADNHININSGVLDILTEGTVRNTGTITIHQGARLTNRGSLLMVPNSLLTVSGFLTSSTEAKFSVNGTITISKDGLVSNRGSFTIGKQGVLRNLGQFTLEPRSQYTNNGAYRRSASGIFTDNRKNRPSGPGTGMPTFDKFTAAILDNEPRVSIHGIDVSRWQGEIDWEQVAASGVKFVMMRAAIGAHTDRNGVRQGNSVDRMFRENIVGAQAHGIEVGVYMYSYAVTVPQARAEAEFLVELLKDYEITYPVAYDLEDDTQKNLGVETLTQMVEAFFEVLIEHNYYPMLYSYNFFLTNRIDPRVLETYAIWMAHINTRQSNYRFPYHIWQYSHTGRVPGIRGGTGNVDLNVSYYDFAYILRKHGLNNLK